MKLDFSFSRMKRGLDKAFVDREMIIRSNGEVRFLKLTAATQKRFAAAFVSIIAIWAVSIFAVVGNQLALSAEQSELAERRSDIASAEQKIDAYRDHIDNVAKDVEERQDALDMLWKAYFGDKPMPAKAMNDADGETTEKLGALLPGASHLETMEGRQLAFVGRLDRLADARADDAARKIAAYGLDPKRIAFGGDAQGGPFIPAFRKNDAMKDPRFAALAASLDRMHQLENALANMPSASPSIFGATSSRFGLRRDPLTGETAMHSGMDFHGAHGSAILAAADGKIVFAGRKGGYGNLVEIDHGNGIHTRYAHLSRIDAKPGQRVSRGAEVGRMGSTGRSTGTHLHFEVRVHDRAVDPAKFLAQGDAE